jgi:hypothetical protein
MGATRPASGLRGIEKGCEYEPYQIIAASFPTRDASPPLEVASSTERYPARRIAPILVSISTRHLQYFFTA